jgi:hypothetical protein
VCIIASKSNLIVIPNLMPVHACPQEASSEEEAYEGPAFGDIAEEEDLEFAMGMSIPASSRIPDTSSGL